ncbi:ornithine carbamoyltransferase [Grosmannia clavigera kw1407]|uniref:Ornithine carbamoyltransferase, mitochondrial n=1 Tax=Grosmannia clavigera (strain kw1407 / UAMH 11150) TaxID=655863 RepID=F0X7X7_GROCL|nr:ornithine carbamoyltransferase [Grosmannia clavigera kw1407]EFX06637.1 ornithine carbamoyltransferase [Grosmannia clavigera kw1407]
MRSSFFRAASTFSRNIQTRAYSTPRHLMSIADLSSNELAKLVLNAAEYKAAYKAGNFPEKLKGSLSGPAVALMFSKRSTRTRVSTESAVSMMGGHPMFLGKDDIQLGVNESLLDTSKVISSMTSAIVARVGPHSDVTGLAKDSSVPVINALSADFHPLQTIADFLTIHEAFPATAPGSGGLLLGVDVAVASPKGYGIPDRMRSLIQSSGSSSKLIETTRPEEAIKDADILVTDTWVSMGQEAEAKKRLASFAGYQITNELAARGGAKPSWKFMHCLPRHPEEVADEVFYGPQSLVFQEAENRLWAAMAALDAFVVNKGVIV